ncbi:MAG: hypothetical protein ACRDPY_09345 [Streptosporangiaceae bacterium]
MADFEGDLADDHGRGRGHLDARRPERQPDGIRRDAPDVRRRRHPSDRGLAIPGTGNPDHLAANVAAGALRLSADEMARRDAVAGDLPKLPR